MNKSGISPFSQCDATLDDSVVVGPFARICADVSVGLNCVIAAHSFVGSGARLGRAVHVGEGAYIGPGVNVGDEVTIGPRAVLVGADGRGTPAACVSADACIGAGAVVSWGFPIGAGAVVEDGAVVNRPVPAHAVVRGNPAQIAGYRNSRVPTVTSPGMRPADGRTTIPGVTLHELHSVFDMRGNLTVAELARDIPFEVRRMFFVHDVPNQELRGEHAHRACHQFLIAASGSLHVVAEDGDMREEFILDRRSLGLHLPPMIWATQYRHSPGAVLLVLASHSYDAGDYIRDYGEYLRLVNEGRRAK